MVPQLSCRFYRVKKDKFGYPIRPEDPEIQEPKRTLKDLLSKAPLPRNRRAGEVGSDHKTFQLKGQKLGAVSSVITDSFTALSPASNVNDTVRAVYFEEGMRRVGLIGRKMGETRTFLRTGEMKISTLIEVPTNHVLDCSPSLNTRELGGPSVKIRLAAFDHPDVTEVPLVKQKEYMSMGLVPKQAEYYFHVSPELALPPHFTLDISHFLLGQCVDITARSVPRGFQGVIRRHGYKGMKMNLPGKTHRRPGSISTQGLARVLRGKKLPGMMGDSKTRSHKHKILQVDYSRGEMVISGVIPGLVGCFCYLRDSVEKDPIQGPLLHCPTFLGDREILGQGGIRYDASVVDPSETFEETMAKKIPIPNWYF